MRSTLALVLAQALAPGLALACTCLALPALAEDSNLWQGSVGDTPSSLVVQVDVSPQSPVPKDQPVQPGQQVVWLQWQAQSMDTDWTALGAQVGWEGVLGLGFVNGATELPISLVTALGLPVRFHAFNVPVPGSLAVHVDGEWVLGGGKAWSNGFRFSALLGLRATLALPAASTLELDWSLAPQLMGTADEFAPLSHSEHRGRALLGIGNLAAGLAVVRSQQTVTPRQALPGSKFDAAESWTFSLILQRWWP